MSTGSTPTTTTVTFAADNNKPSPSPSPQKNGEKILKQTWMYPYKQISLLLSDDDKTKKAIMAKTKCKIKIRYQQKSNTSNTADSNANGGNNNNNEDETDHRMVKITLEGSADAVFNGHKEINYIRQHGRMMSDTQRRKPRFADNHFKKHGYGSRQPTKLNNWNLNVTNKTMKKVVSKICSKSDATNWAILEFADSDDHEKTNTKPQRSSNDTQSSQANGTQNKQKKVKLRKLKKKKKGGNAADTKILVIDKYGKGGVSVLAKQLANVKELKYCMLRFDYGFDIKRHQIILVIWSPSSARSSQRKDIIPMLRHKPLIKQTLRSTYELTISIHSYLNSSFILSELHSKNLVPEILLRVTLQTTTYGNNQNDNEHGHELPESEETEQDEPQMPDVGGGNKRTSLSRTSSTGSLGASTPSIVIPPLKSTKTMPNLRYPKVDKFFASKDWTLKELKVALATKYKLKAESMQITHILHQITKRSAKFNAPRQTEHIFNDNENLNQTLSMLGLYHGSQIYISTNSETEPTPKLSNTFLAAQRRLQFTHTKTETMMSKTHKIKIKLKLSTHLQNMKSLQTLKQQKQNEIRKQKLQLKKNTSTRVARYEEWKNEDQSPPQRGISKSVYLPKTIQPKIEAVDIDPDENDTPNEEQPTQSSSQDLANNNNDEEYHKNTIDDIGVYTAKSFPHVAHFKQSSMSDPEFVGLHSISVGPDDEEEEDEDQERDFSNASHSELIKDAPSHARGSRTRSLSTTVAEKMAKNIVDQIENGDDYNKQQTVTPAMVPKSKHRASAFVKSKHSDEVKSEYDIQVNGDVERKQVETEKEKQTPEALDQDDHEEGPDEDEAEHVQEEDEEFDLEPEPSQVSIMDVDDDEKQGKFDVAEDDAEEEDNEDGDDDVEDDDDDEETKEDLEISVSLPPSAPSTPVIASLSSSDMMNTTEIECTLDLNEVFIVEKSIGRGKTAHVHYAVYKNECDIALKEFRFGRLTDKILLDFHSELETLKKLDHDNICRLLGHYVDEKSKQLYLAFEWLPCGCLYDVIHDKNVSIEFVDVLEMSLDIARGMRYLHEQKIIHRDLKSHNLLLDEAYRVKITDFGTAKTLDKVAGTTYTEVGTGGYCAPEVIEQPLQGYDRKVDVFSYGVLLWEIFERGKVFDQQSLRNISKLKQGQRPTISAHCPPRFRQLINDCWQLDPCKRPNFEEIVDVLETMYVEIQQSDET